MNFNEPQNLQSNIGAVSSRLISEAILNDKQLQALYSERVKIYSIAIPTVILKTNGEAETVWIDETNHPNLSKINELIEHRIQQIKNFYA
jgi:hypothetical protein